MDNTTSASRPPLHPLLWVAGISVTLLSLTGIASLTGLLPLKSEQPAVVATVPAPVAVVVPPVAAVEVPPVVAQPEKPVPTAKPQAVKTPKKVATVDHPASTTPKQPASHGTEAPPDYVPPPPVAAAPCANCGTIDDVRQISREGEGSGIGAVAGGVLGGVLGNQVGRGDGRALATIAGAIGGGFLGNKVEKTQRQSTAYQITVRMEDGRSEHLESATMPPWRIGDSVRVVNGTIVVR